MSEENEKFSDNNISQLIEKPINQESEKQSEDLPLGASENKDIIKAFIENPDNLTEENYFKLSMLSKNEFESLLGSVYEEAYDKKGIAGLANFSKVETIELASVRKNEAIQEISRSELNLLLDNIEDKKVIELVNNIDDKSISVSKFFKYFLNKAEDIFYGVGGVAKGTYDGVVNIYEAAQDYWQAGKDEIEASEKTVEKYIEAIKIPINSIKFAGMLLLPWNWLTMRNTNVLIDQMLNKEHNSYMEALVDEYQDNNIETTGSTIKDALNINKYKIAKEDADRAVLKRNESISSGNIHIKKSWEGIKHIAASIWRIIKL